MLAHPSSSTEEVFRCQYHPGHGDGRGMGTRMMDSRLSQPMDPRHGLKPDRTNKVQYPLDPLATSAPGTPSKSSNTEQVQRFAGLGIGLGSVCAEYLISHPCQVLRRQCQVHHASQWYHLTPFTAVQVLFNIQCHQSVTTMWKGIGSTFIVKGLQVVTEAGISEFTPLPREVSRHSSLKKLAEHVLLKGLSFMATTPFYAASLVETVQSEIASERPGVLDCIREGCTRSMGWHTSQTTRLLPIWRLVAPSTAYFLSRYIITSLAEYTVSQTLHVEQDSKGSMADQEATTQKTMYESYYPQLLATFTGNLIADVMLYPLETILNRLCVQGTRTIIDNTDTGFGVVPIITRYEGFFDCLKSIVLEEGITGLYKGFGMVCIQYMLHFMLLKVSKFLFEQLGEGNRPKGVLVETLHNGSELKPDPVPGYQYPPPYRQSPYHDPRRGTHVRNPDPYRGTYM